MSYPTVLACLLAVCLFSTQAAWPQQHIVIGEEVQHPGVAPALANALCSLYGEARRDMRFRESGKIWDVSRCTAKPLSKPIKSDWITSMLGDDIHVVITTRAEVKKAWDDTKGDLSRSLRSVFQVNDRKFIVSSSKVSEWLVAELVNVSMDQIFRLIEIYPPARSMVLDNRAVWYDPLDESDLPPHHLGLWPVFRKRQWIQEEPFWVIVGSDKTEKEAVYEAKVLHKKNGKEFPQGLQIRRSTNGLYATIDGFARTRDDARNRSQELLRVTRIRGPYAFPALTGEFPELRGWGRNLLSQ